MHVYLYMLVYYACVCLLIAVQCLPLIYTFRVPRIEVETDMLVLVVPTLDAVWH